MIETYVEIQANEEDCEAMHPASAPHPALMTLYMGSLDLTEGDGSSAS